MSRFMSSRSLSMKLLLEILLSFILTIGFSLATGLFIFSPYLKAHQNNLNIPFYTFLLIADFMSMIGFFILCFLLMSNRHVKYIKYIAKKIKLIASRNLGETLEIRGNDELAVLCMNINFMSQELKDKFEYERELERTKSELITNVSHDLRTPLTAIIGYLDILKNEKFSGKEEEKEYLNSTYNLSIKLKKLIDELFEYTKLVSSDIVLEFVETDIVAILIQILGEYTPVLENKGLSVVTSITDVAQYVMIDVEKMVRVFDNILSNAEKYSSKPSQIIVKTDNMKDDIIISISNKSEYIEEDRFKKIFEKFYRVDNSRSSNIEGSGLGLAISKKIVELHNGKIWAECHGDMITMYISLPIIKN